MVELIPVFSDYSNPQINILINEKAADCESCGAYKRSLVFYSDDNLRPRYALSCTRCGVMGPFGRHLEAAVDKWNKKQDKILYTQDKSEDEEKQWPFIGKKRTA